MLHSGTIVFIMCGLFVGYLKANYDYDPLSFYNKYYYIWAKTVDVLLLLCVLNPMKHYRKYWAFVIFFMGIRCVWEIFAIQNYTEASKPSIIFILFLICTVCLTGLLWMDTRNAIGKWLKLS